LIPLGFLELLALFEAGIVIFPPASGAAPSRRESNASVLLTLIAVWVLFPLVTFPREATFPPDVTVPRERGGSLNGGACESGSG